MKKYLSGFRGVAIWLAALLPVVTSATQIDLSDCGVSVRFSGPTIAVPEDQGKALLAAIFPSNTRDIKIKGASLSDVVFGRPYREQALCFCAFGFEANSLKSEITRRGQWGVRVTDIGPGTQSPQMDWDFPGFTNLKHVSRMIAVERRDGCFVYQHVYASIENVRDLSTRFFDSLSPMTRASAPPAPTQAADLEKIASLRKKCASLGFPEQTDANTACVVKMMTPD
jgi:hypothetical protein